MPDMLVKLYDLPELDLSRQEAQGITVRRAIAPEKHIVVGWVREHFNDHWASEAEVAFTNTHITCYIATQENTILGFACHDVSARNFFGPTGVDQTQRGKGIGAVLLLMALHAMRWDGYGYAIIGGVGPAEFYTKIVGASLIPDSTPGIYKGMLK